MSFEAHLKRLDESFPPPRESLTLEEVVDVIGGSLQTIRNQLSGKTPRAPFPVVRIGGRITVSKIAIAKLLSGQDPFKSDEDKPDTPRRGRPKNSAGLQRFAALSLYQILIDRESAEHAALTFTAGNPTLKRAPHPLRRTL